MELEGIVDDDINRLPPLAHCLRQSKINEYFPPLNLSLVPGGTSSTCNKTQNRRKREWPQRASFLSLPREIREKVYRYMEMPHGGFIDLNRRNGNAPLFGHLCLMPLGSWRERSQLWDEGDDGISNTYTISNATYPINLLHTSRVVRQEVEEKLYSENAVSVSLFRAEGLSPLESLSVATLRHLKTLIVVLCPCQCLEPSCQRSCAFESDDFTYWMENQRPPKKHSRRLGCISRRDKAFIAQWKRICARLAANISPDQLGLYFSADVADVQVAKKVLEPMYSLPMLRDAAISLRNTVNSELRVLAKTTVRQLLAEPELSIQPFRFLDLPYDLQRYVLEFTGLVSPAHILWDPNERLANSRPETCRSMTGIRDDGPISDSVLFCGVEEAAYCRHCKCRFSPVLDLFLVSKSFHDVARMVFYSQNIFRVMPSAYFPISDLTGNADDNIHNTRSSYYNFTASSFLARMPPIGIQNLRHVCYVFPPITPTYLLPQQKAWNDWLRSIDLLSQYANLPALKLEFHFADQNVLPLEDLRQRRIRNKHREEAEMYETYVRILAPLKKLVGLKVLLIYVAWPTHEKAVADRKENEKKLEKMIMGDGYDSSKWGKEETSQWSQPDRFWWLQYH